MKENVDIKLKKYVETNILPEYANFDEGHGTRHIKSVVERSLEYYDEFVKRGYNLNINMIYVVACYHDIGMKIEREKHAVHSSEILLADENLKDWFSEKEIAIMAQAVEDHSTSSKCEPRSIYGMIVADSDKDRDERVGLIRGYKFCKKNHPEYSLEELAEDVHKEIVRRFGGEDIGGKSLVRFYLNSEKNKDFMSSMIEYAYNKEVFIKRFYEVVNEENLKEQKQHKKPNAGLGE